MIPKKIHYCWLGREKMPSLIDKCLETWKNIMPDYEMVLWDEKRFDVNSLAFIANACKVKRYAFASDYIRLYALYTEGGIYFDTDVIVKKRFDDLLSNDFFSGIELHYGIVRKKYPRKLLYKEELPDIVPDTPWIGLLSAIIGSIPGHYFLKDCLDWYQDNEHAIQPEMIKTDEPIFEVLAPEMYATIALKYGFTYKNAKQELLHNMAIYPTSTFAGDVYQATRSNYAIHFGGGEWRKKNNFYVKLSKNKLLRKIFGKEPLKNQSIDTFDMLQKFYELS